MKDIQNTLYYGDNIEILREYIADESIDLIYLDPPFNSNRQYNVLFKDESGHESEAQINAFEDSWHWDKAAQSIYEELITEGPASLSSFIGSLFDFIGPNQMMAYLVMLSVRLIELHRILKPRGTIYFHCDPTASHYIKLLLDTIFDPKCFLNEIVWKRTNAKSLAFTNYANNHDIIFRYSKSDEWIWNPQFTPHDPEYIKKFYRYKDKNGRLYRLSDITNPNKDRPNLTRVWRWTKDRMKEANELGLIYQSKPGNVPALIRYLDKQRGNPIGDIWTDIIPVQAQAAERLGYPTQKPMQLLERIILSSSNENDVVLDPFCGCGTTITVAEKLKRKWVGIDITHLAIALQKYRLKDSFNIEEGNEYNVIGEPNTLSAAKQLAKDKDGRYQFQWWALSLIKAQPVGGMKGSRIGKKGKDRGIDGIIQFIDDPSLKPKKILVQVKSGKVNSKDIRDLRGSLEREKAVQAVFITLEKPTKDMKKEAITAGFYESHHWGKKYSKIQILTIEDLLNHVNVDMPPVKTTFKKAKKIDSDEPVQKELKLN